MIGSSGISGRLRVAGCQWSVVGCWLLNVGCWLLVVGCWLLVVGCWLFPLPEGEGQGEGQTTVRWPLSVSYPRDSSAPRRLFESPIRARSDPLIEQSPHPQRFSRAPGLRVVAAMRMRPVAVHDFGKVTQAMLVQQRLHAAQISPGSGDGFRGKIPCARQGVAENRESQ